MGVLLAFQSQSHDQKSCAAKADEVAAKASNQMYH